MCRTLDVVQERDALNDAPEAIRWGTPATRYARVAGLVAEHDRPPGSAAAGARLVLDDGRIAVWRGAPPGGDRAWRLGPVYGSDDGHLAVPTGKVSVRFADGTDARSRADDLKRAGFRIESVPRFAPHTAWVSTEDDDIVRALCGVARLATLRDVVHVEPQLLLPRAAR